MTGARSRSSTNDATAISTRSLSGAARTSRTGRTSWSRRHRSSSRRRWHPKALIADLLRQTKDAEAEQAASESGFQADLFADFNGLPDEDARTEFYQHDANWSNRMILGDSLQVMASLAEREGLRGKVAVHLHRPACWWLRKAAHKWRTTDP